MPNERKEALRNLILLRTPVADVARELKAFPWDSTEPLITFSRSDGRHVLDAYLSGGLDERILEQWANVMESRDDIGFEAGCEALLKDFIFHIANPCITKPLTPEVASEWKIKLQ